MFATQFELIGHTIEIATLEDKHISTLWTLLYEEENMRLYRQYYSAAAPNSEQDFSEVILSASQQDPDTRATGAIVNRCTSDVLGWLTVQSQVCDTPKKAAEGAIFLPRAVRTERGTECMYYTTRILFDKLGYDAFEFRAGTLTEAWGPGGGQLGRSLIGVLSRQMLDRSRSAESDLYIVKRAEWPAVSLAVGAWLDSKVTTDRKGAVSMPS